jgi:hypothetical protein
MRGTSPIFSQLRRLIDQANRSSVVIYAVDPRGLAITGITAADDTSGRSPEQIRQVESDRNMELFETQVGLQYLSRQTGGVPVDRGGIVGDTNERAAHPLGPGTDGRERLRLEQSGRKP